MSAARAGRIRRVADRQSHEADASDMSKKKDQERRSQWSWADNVHPKEIDHNHVLKAYRIGLPKCKPLSCR